MNILVNDIVEFENGFYKIVDIFSNKENTYAYLINNDKFINDVSIVKCIKNNNHIDFMQIEDDKEFEYVLKRLYLNHKRDILSYYD